MRQLLQLLLIALLAFPGFAQADRTDAFIQAQMQAQRVPGLALLVRKDGKIVKAAGYGFADVTLKTPVTADTIFKIGSVSKQFIAAAVMVLVQRDKLGLDDPIDRYIKDAPAAWKPITIRHLLTHTAGLVREGPGFDPSKIQSDADVIRSAYRVPLVFPTGQKWQYSNLGYFMLADIIRVVSGRPWSGFIDAEIFKPSGMSATRPTTTSVRVPNMARGYTDNDKWREAQDWPALRPSGAFLSTILDLAKWDAVLDTDAVLTAASRREMTTPASLAGGASHPYGFGWHLGSAQGHRKMSHGGGLPGFTSQYLRLIDGRLTVIVLLNTDDADTEGIALGVAALYLTELAARRVGERDESSGCANIDTGPERDERRGELSRGTNVVPSARPPARQAPH